MEINNLNKEMIIRHSKESYPNECCGLLVRQDENTTAIPCENISRTPLSNFIVKYEDVKKYSFENIIAIYHSHKDNNDFSLSDIYFSEKLKKNSVLYVVDNDLFRTYIPNGFAIPYIGRPFFIGHLDCLTLLSDYYERELNIKLSDLKEHKELNHQTWKEQLAELKTKHPNVAQDHLLSNNFFKVPNLRKNDVILFREFNKEIPVSVHFAIYIGNNKILHHLDDISGIENYTNGLKRLTFGYYRHITLK